MKDNYNVCLEDNIMKKIGILTFHRAYNFGAVLQTYALEETIRMISNNTEVSVIDYRNDRIENAFHSKSLKSKLKNVIKFVLHHDYYVDTQKKAELFDTFIEKYISVSTQYESADEFKNEYDSIIVGSDQVWNLDMTINDMNYFLPYDVGAKKLSYAASFGKSKFSEEQKKAIHAKLLSFDSILVRESDGEKLATNLGVEAHKVVDPTLLISKEHWESLCEVCKVNKPYILIYIVASETYSISLAKKIAKKNGWDIIYVDPPRYKFEDVNKLKEAGPSQFLWLIKNAEIVITTSYHGLILSMNLNIPFLYELSHIKGNTNSRLEEIIETYQLWRYAIDSDNMEQYADLKYDWEHINNRIIDNRQKSLTILCDSIG